MGEEHMLVFALRAAPTAAHNPCSMTVHWVDLAAGLLF